MPKPSCQYCSSTHVISNGNKWHCRNCGRQWVKAKVSRIVPDYKERPPCPKCGAYEGRFQKKGFMLQCFACGHVYRNDWQEQREILKQLNEA